MFVQIKVEYLGRERLFKLCDVRSVEAAEAFIKSMYPGIKILKSEKV